MKAFRDPKQQQPQQQPQYYGMPMQTSSNVTYAPQQQQISTGDKILNDFKNVFDKIATLGQEPTKVPSGVSLLEEPAPAPIRNYKSTNKPTKAPKKVLTPAEKLMKVTAGKATPSDAEVSTFRKNMTTDSIDEFIEGLDNSDWKVKVRAIFGLNICGEVFGYETVAHTKGAIQGLMSAPQKSLKEQASKFYQIIQKVIPGGAPVVLPTAQANVQSNDEVIDFSAE